MLTKIKKFLLNDSHNSSQFSKKRVKSHIKQTTKKQIIPATIRNVVWNENIGLEKGNSVCLCCKSEPITRANFQCGHIISEKNGGTLHISNLRPICQHCNTSIGARNMDDFIKMYGLDKIKKITCNNNIDTEQDIITTDTFSDVNFCDYDKFKLLSKKDKIMVIDKGLPGFDNTDILILEIKNNNIDMAKKIIDKCKIDVAKRNHQATKYALKSKDIDLVKLLESKCGKPYYSKGNGIKYVILNNDIPMIKYILYKSKYKEDNKKIIPVVLQSISKSKKLNPDYKNIMNLLKRFS